MLIPRDVFVSAGSKLFSKCFYFFGSITSRALSKLVPESNARFVLVQLFAEKR